MFEDITKVVLLSDMDGTLLNSRKEVTPADKAAIERFRRLGGHFSVATGRTIQSFEQYCSIIGLPDPVIMYNGTAIHDYSINKTLFTQPLTTDAKRIAMRIMELMPEIGGEVLRAEGTYVFSNNDYQKLHTKICNIVPNYTDLPDIPDGGWLKVLFAMAPEDIPHIELLVQQEGFSGVSFVKSSDIFYEMLPEGVSKGSALAEYRRLPGFEGFTFAAIGDFDNDLEMVEGADLGACPANAEASVKSRADLVLSRTNDDGAVAELIEHIIARCGAEAEGR